MITNTNVAPGQQHTYTYNVTAPATPGTTAFQWRMVHDGVTWFGDFTPNIDVTVNALPATLTALWRFDEVSGAIASDTANGIPQNASLLNAPTRIVGRSGNALQFNGTNQYLQVASAVDINPTAAITLAVWAKSDPTRTVWNTSQTFMSKRNAYILGPVNSTTKSVQFQLYIAGAWKTLSFT
ncbi:MAG: hypothetical protein H7Y36_00995, partial [Armatimonadetes bacterium]|nr:hypothetical protein [Akkermansiaceae bacterium]